MRSRQFWRAALIQLAVVAVPFAILAVTVPHHFFKDWGFAVGPVLWVGCSVVTARILRLGYRIHEVPIRYYARSREEGKKLTWRDGLHAITALVRLRMSSDQRLFGRDHDREYHEARQRELARSHPLIKSDGV